MSAEDIQQSIEDMPEDCFEIVPENWDAFIWFTHVSEFWIWSNGMRVALDIRTILQDADVLEREFTKDDYIKLKTLGRHAVAAQAENNE